MVRINTFSSLETKFLSECGKIHGIARVIHLYIFDNHGIDPILSEYPYNLNT